MQAYREMSVCEEANNPYYHFVCSDRRIAEVDGECEPL